MRRRLRVRILDDVVEDIGGFSHDIARESGAEAGLAFEEAVARTFSFPQAFPRAGRSVQQSIFADARTYAVRRFRNHIIHYAVEASAIVVIRIVHGASHRSLASPPPSR
jgi:plasmid stabilization system protein ParE